MKALLPVLSMVLVAACAHTPDVQLSDEDALRIAREYAARRHISLKGLRPDVGRFDTGISVTFSDPVCDAGCLDKLPLLFFIPAGKRRVTQFQDGRV